MIYKDLFRIKINGVEYTEKHCKRLFTLKEMKKIYVDNIDKNVVAIYEPLLVEDILSEAEMAGD